MISSGHSNHFMSQCRPNKYDMDFYEQLKPLCQSDLLLIPLECRLSSQCDQMCKNVYLAHVCTQHFKKKDLNKNPNLVSYGKEF